MKDRTRLLIVDEQVWIPYTYAEEAMIVDIMEKLPEEQVAEPVTFAGISNGKRTTEKQASLYDAMMQEIMGEKERRLRKYLRKHEIRNNGKPVRKEKRKSYRKELCFRCDPWHGWETVSEFRYAEKMRTDDADWKLESAEIELDAEFNFWMQKIEDERLASLNEWLKYA